MKYNKYLSDIPYWKIGARATNPKMYVERKFRTTEET